MNALWLRNDGGGKKDGREGETEAWEGKVGRRGAGPAVYPGRFCKQYLALIISNFLPLNCILDIS